MSSRKTLWINILQFSIGWVILFLLSYFFGGEYTAHIQQHSHNITAKGQLQNNLDNFSLSQITDISNISLVTTPSLTLLDDIVGFIDTAETEIFIEVYLLTEKRIPKALIRAHNRWIDIKIIVEKNPYKAYNINNKNYQLLQQSGMNIIWSHVENYSLNHSKLILIDGMVIISTGNLSYSTFSKNRDLFILIDDLHIYTLFRDIFLADFDGQPTVSLPPKYTTLSRFFQNKIRNSDILGPRLS